MSIRSNVHFVVAFYDAFSNMEDATVSLMVEYMDGGSLQDIVDTVGQAGREELPRSRHPLPSLRARGTLPPG